VLWELTGKAWSRTDLEPPAFAIGTILGCGLANYMTDKGKPDHGMSRLFAILVSEAAFLTWKIRCEWCIQHEGDPKRVATKTEITNRWIQAISHGIIVDIATTDTRHLKKKAVR